MSTRRGEIYWIQPSDVAKITGNVQAPGRPGIVVSNDANNIHSQVVEIVYLTTAPKKDLPTHCTIRSSRETSTALCENIMSVSVEQIGNYIGTCTESEMIALDACLATSLGLNIFNPELFQVQAEDLDGPKVIEDHDDKERILLEKKLSYLTETHDQLTAQLIESKAREKLLRELYDSLIRSKTE